MIGIHVTFECRLVHQASDGKVGQKESVGFLPYELEHLMRNTIRAPLRWVLSSSKAVSISDGSWYKAANSLAGASLWSMIVVIRR